MEIIRTMNIHETNHEVVKQSQQYMSIFISDQPIFLQDNSPPIVNIDINGNIIEVLHINAPDKFRNRFIIFIASKSIDAINMSKNFFIARMHEIFMERINCDSLRESESNSCTEYFVKVLSNSKDYITAIKSCLRIMEIKTHDIDLFCNDLIEVLTDNQFDRHVFNNIQFNVAQTNESYRRCFEFLMKESSGLFNFYGKKLYDNELNEFIQCRNKMFFIERIKDIGAIKKYIGEENKNNVYSLMIYATMSGFSIREDNDCSVHKEEKKEIKYNETDKYIRILNRQIDIANRQLMRQREHIPQIIAAANILLINNSSQSIIILNGLAVKKEMHHHHIGTQILEHCLYTVNPKCMIAFIPLRVLSQKGCNATDVEFYDKSMRACAFFKAVSRDDKSSVSIRTNIECVKRDRQRVECMKYIIMNKN